MGIISSSSPLSAIGMMDRRIALAIVTLALCGALWAALSKTMTRRGGLRDEQGGTSVALLSDLPGHYFTTSTSGPCYHSFGSELRVLLVQVRAEPNGIATVYAQTENWPMMPMRISGRNTELASARSNPTVGSIALPFSDREALTQLVDDAGEPGASSRCILYRADQSLRAGDVYSVGFALQRMEGSQVLVFPELALD